MKILSKFKNGLITLILAFTLASTMAASAFAATPTPNTDSSVRVNDVIESSNGKEVVVYVFNDGRFATIPLEDVSTFASCSHTSIIGMGTKHKEVINYNKTNSTYCYKYKYYEDARCAQCGKTGYKIYDKSWTNVEHKYKLFGKTCTVCGYQK